MSVAYCDASYQGNERGVIAVVCGKKLIRKYVRARNSSHAEMIAVLVARKVFGKDTVCVTDNELVACLFKKDELRLKKILKRTFNVEKDTPAFLKVAESMTASDVIWAPRRSNDELRIADNLTRDGTNIGWERYNRMGYEFVTVV